MNREHLELLGQRVHTCGYHIVSTERHLSETVLFSSPKLKWREDHRSELPGEVFAEDPHAGLAELIVPKLITQDQPGGQLVLNGPHTRDISLRPSLLRFWHIDAPDEPIPPILPEAVRIYRPFAPEHTSLFLEFAATMPSESGVLAFANEYGLLYGRPTRFVEYKVGGRVDYVEAELLSEWRRDLDRLGTVVGLWQAWNTSDDSKLAEMFYRASDGATYITLDRGVGRGVPVSLRLADSTESLPDGDELRAMLLGQLFSYSGVVSSTLTSEFYPDWDNGGDLRLRMRFVIDTLSDVIRLQFAMAVDGNVKHRPCKECGRWFEVSPDVARTSRVFCGTACRVRNYRRRQATARSLTEKGYTPEDIAEQLGSDADTVRGWVGKEGRPHGKASRP